MEFQVFLFLYLTIIISSIIHEYSHGWMANVLGDPTAKNEGRLTLNPLAHIDWFGTVMLPIIFMVASGFRSFFGYAKPVPFNPHNLRNQKQGIMLIALAGPLSNFILAIILGLLVRFSVLPFLNIPLAFIAEVNIWLAVFNLLPLAMLDGAKILAGLLPFAWQETVGATSHWGSFIIALWIAYSILPVIVFKITQLIIGSSLLL